MKRAFVALALLAAPAPARAEGSADSAHGQASATIVAPLAITPLADLDFGGVALASGSAGGAVTIAADGSAPDYAGVGPVACASTCTPRRARFRVRGEAGRHYRLSLPESVAAQPADGPGPALPVTRLAGASRNLPGDPQRGRLDGAGEDELAVGGTLTIPAGTPPGRYVAQVPVRVTYE